MENDGRSNRFTRDAHVTVVNFLLSHGTSFPLDVSFEIKNFGPLALNPKP